MPEAVRLLRYHPPFAWPVMLEFFAARAVDGVEQVAGDCYRRLLRVDDAGVLLTVSHAAEAGALRVTCANDAPAVLATALTAVTRVFDLDTDPVPIAHHLRHDALLARGLAACPGLRPPGAWDGFELAVRAVLGQQISVTAARALAGRLVALCGTPVAVPAAPALTHLFPAAADLARADLASLGMPGARRRTLHAIAHAVLADPGLLAPGVPLADAIARWCAIPGIGEWTAQYIALRALRAPDAFPVSDIGLLRAAADGGPRPSPRALQQRAEAWRPWRAYAAQYLWSVIPAGGTSR